MWDLFGTLSTRQQPLQVGGRCRLELAVPFGIQLRCGHSYCVQDATTYIASRLDDDNGSLMKVFPIQCPEVCTRVEDRDERDLS